MFLMSKVPLSGNNRSANARERFSAGGWWKEPNHQPCEVPNHSCSRRLIVHYSSSKYKVDGFVGKLTF